MQRLPYGLKTAPSLSTDKCKYHLILYLKRFTSNKRNVFHWPLELNTSITLFQNKTSKKPQIKLIRLLTYHDLKTLKNCALSLVVQHTIQNLFQNFRHYEPTV